MKKKGKEKKCGRVEIRQLPSKTLKLYKVRAIPREGAVFSVMDMLKLEYEIRKLVKS